MDTLHTFCEVSYAMVPYTAEFWKILSSLFVVVPPLLSLRRLHMMQQPKKLQLRWQATAGSWLLVMTGLGSAGFHATMCYHAKLLDEIPMLLLLSIAFVNLAGAHPWTRTPNRAFAAHAMYSGSLVSVVSLTTRWHVLLVTGFVVGIIGLLIGFLTKGGASKIVCRLSCRVLLLVILSGVAREIESNLCLVWPEVWMLHNLWHVGMAFAANDLCSTVYLYRVEVFGADAVVQDADEKARGQLVPFFMSPALRQPSLADMSCWAERVRAGRRRQAHSVTWQSPSTTRKPRPSVSPPRSRAHGKKTD